MKVLLKRPGIEMTEAEFRAIKDFWDLMGDENFIDIDWCDVGDTLSYYLNYFETENKIWLQGTSFEIVIKKNKGDKE